MATNVEDAQTMVRASEASGKLLMVAYRKRYDEGVLKAKEILDNLVSSGELSEITFVRVHDFGGDWICGYDEPVIATDEPYPEVRPRPSARARAPSPRSLPCCFQREPRA